MQLINLVTLTSLILSFNSIDCSAAHHAYHSKKKGVFNSFFRKKNNAHNPNPTGSMPNRQEEINRLKGEIAVAEKSKKQCGDALNSMHTFDATHDYAKNYHMLRNIGHGEDVDASPEKVKQMLRNGSIEPQSLKDKLWISQPSNEVEYRKKRKIEERQKIGELMTEDQKNDSLWNARYARWADERVDNNLHLEIHQATKDTQKAQTNLDKLKIKYPGN